MKSWKLGVLVVCEWAHSSGYEMRVSRYFMKTLLKEHPLKVKY